MKLLVHQMEGSLREHLKSGEFIQSEDPALIAKAREMTQDSCDSWEAARRLSRWMAENIKSAIPGGITARGT